jgi:hypothetical protein
MKCHCKIRENDEIFHDKTRPCQTTLAKSSACDQWLEISVKTGCHQTIRTDWLKAG